MESVENAGAVGVKEVNAGAVSVKEENAGAVRVKEEYAGAVRVKEENAGAVRVKEEYADLVALGVQVHGKPEFWFIMKRDDPLRKLKLACCERLELGDYKEVLFIFVGRRVRCNPTPNDLGLQNGDVIYAWLHQRGC